MTVGRKLLFSLPLALIVSACTTGRYVGSVGRDGTYANRGYGFALRVQHRDLHRRWALLDPSKLPTVPTPGLPIPSRDALDRDGDGMLSVGESTLHFDPTVRLLSKTSTGARADIRVEILSGPAKGASLEQLLERALRLWTRTPSITQLAAQHGAETDPVSGRMAKVTTATTANWRHHLAVIDQGTVIVEERIGRRQLVTVHVYSPEPAPTDLEQDFRMMLEALILSRRAAPESVMERW